MDVAISIHFLSECKSSIYTANILDGRYSSVANEALRILLKQTRPKTFRNRLFLVNLHHIINQ